MSTAIMEGDENIGVVNSPRLNRKANVLQPSTVHNIQGSPKKLSESVKKIADPFSVIRQLDDDERWVERTSISTRQDHEDNIVHASQILQDLLKYLPLDRNGCKGSHDKSLDSNRENSTVIKDVKDTAKSVCSESAENKTEDASTNVLIDDKDVAPQDPLTQTVTSKDSICKTSDDIMTSSGYHIDFGHVDEINPFQTSRQLMNSPVLKTLGEKPGNSNTRDGIDSEKENRDDSKVDFCLNLDEIHENSVPFKCKSQIMNSPVGAALMDTKCYNNSAVQPEDVLTEAKDLSSSASGAASHAVPTNQQGDFNLESESDFTINLDEVDETLDTFKASKQMANFPETDNEQATYTINLDEIDEKDPFKPKLQLCNSPVSNGTVQIAGSNLADDPFEPKSQIANTPVKEAGSDFDEVDGLIESFKSKAVIVNSPLSSVNSNQVEDPFKTKSMVANSPVSALRSTNTDDVEDPLKTKSMVANSPISAARLTNVEEVEDLFKTNSMVANSPMSAVRSVNIEEVEDPFKTKSMVANSPVCAARSTNIEEVEDPFKSKSMVANSPVSAARSTNVAEVEDPFKTKSMVANSPCRAASSVITEEVGDPFKTKSVIANSPSKPDTLVISGDPFKTKSKVGNTPTKSPRKVHFQDEDGLEGQAEVDPFKTKSKVAASPKQSPSWKSTEGKALSPKKASSDVQADPVKPHNQGSSPGKTSQKSHSATSTLKENTQPRWQNANSISKSPVKSPSQSPRRVSGAGQSPRGLPKTSPAKSPSRSSVLRSPSKNCSPNCKPASPTKLLQNQSPLKGSPTKPPPIRAPGKSGSPTKKLASPSKSPPIRPPSKNVSVAQEVASSADFPLEKSAVMPPLPAPAPGNHAVHPPAMGSRGDGLSSRLHDPFPRTNFQLSDITEEEFGDELFQPASEVFGNAAFDTSAWDMLENVGSGQVAPYLTRDSLYYKFDPLIKPRQSIARGADLQKRLSCIAGQAKRQSTQLMLLGEENLLGSPDRNKANSVKPDSAEQVRSSVDDIFGSSSPSMDNRPHNPVSFSNADLVEVLQYSEKEMKKICSELELRFQSSMLIKEKSWHEKSQQMETEMKAKHEEMEQELKAQLAEANQKLKDSQAKEAEQESSLEVMKVVVADYANTLSEVIALGEKEREDFQKTLAESGLQKDKAIEDANAADKMFKDLHVRYEKLRSAVELQQKNEETLKKAVTELKAKLEKATQSYKALKQQAEEKLEKARIREEKQEQKTNAIVTRLEASLKRKTGELQALETSFQQKMKQNEELAQLCDELITKVGD